MTPSLNCASAYLPSWHSPESGSTQTSVLAYNRMLRQFEEGHMRSRIATGVGGLAVVCLAPMAAAQTGDISRTPSGRPDLSGTYDVGTLTPMQRPTDLGEKMSLTDEEAAALERHLRKYDGQTVEALVERGNSARLPDFTPVQFERDPGEAGRPVRARIVWQDGKQLIGALTA